MGALLDLAGARSMVRAELLRSCRQRAAQTAELNAWIEIFDDVEGAAGGSLAGIPYACKGNIALAGRELDCASRILEGYRSPFDATVVERLRAAGAVAMGRTNLDEFAMGSSTEHSRHGATRNPWDPTRIAGGSSGGSAVAVASNCAPFALGSDTGGSVRQPASLCGVVGFKPSYGRVSRYGLVAFASSLDQIGPFAHSVRDAAEVYGVIAGADDRDMTSARVEVGDPCATLDRGATGLRVGVPRAMLSDGVDDDVRECFEATLDRLRADGAAIVEIDLPLAPQAVAIYYILASAEASSNLARYDGQLYGKRIAAGTLEDSVRRTRSELLGEEVQRRILLGSFVLSAGYHEAYYGKAQRARRRLTSEYERAFESCDVMATPTSPTTAFRLGERLDDPLTMYLSDVFTVPANLTGMPAISVPSGVDGQGLPIGFHLSAPRFAEERLLSAASAVESVCGFARHRDPILERWSS